MVAYSTQFAVFFHLMYLEDGCILNLTSPEILQIYFYFSFSCYNRNFMRMRTFVFFTAFYFLGLPTL